MISYRPQNSGVGAGALERTDTPWLTVRVDFCIWPCLLVIFHVIRELVSEFKDDDDGVPLGIG